MGDAEYEAGIQLLRSTFRKRMAVRLMHKPYNRAKKRILFAQLKYVFSRSLGNDTAPKPIPSMSAVCGVEAGPKVYEAPWTALKVSRVDYELLPDTLKSEYFRKGKLFVLAAVAHRKLVEINFGKDPRNLNAVWQETNTKLAAEVFDNIAENTRIHAIIDEYIASGKLPEDPKPKLPEPEDMSLAELNKRIRVRKSNLATYKTRLKTASEAKQAKIVAKINSLNAEIKYLTDLRDKQKENGGKHPSHNQ